IFQHYRDIVDSVTSVVTRSTESVATAVIEVTAPPGTEYPTPDSYDVRLEIARTTGSGTLSIISHTRYYNVTVAKAGPLPDDQTRHGHSATSTPSRRSTPGSTSTRRTRTANSSRHRSTAITRRWRPTRLG